VGQSADLHSTWKISIVEDSKELAQIVIIKIAASNYEIN
jgi:hypothetical protein